MLAAWSGLWRNEFPSAQMRNIKAVGLNYSGNNVSTQVCLMAQTYDTSVF